MNWIDESWGSTAQVGAIQVSVMEVMAGYEVSVRGYMYSHRSSILPATLVEAKELARTLVRLAALEVLNATSN
jgi:hypothetical protein